jgi:hypothetical protein
MKTKVMFSLILILAACSLQMPDQNVSEVTEMRVASTTRIEAEYYYRMNGIQTEGCSEGGSNVGWIDVGDWMSYRVNIVSSGDYLMRYRVASPYSSGRVQFKVGSSVLAETTIPRTGGWQTWDSVTTVVNLQAGSQTITLRASGQLWNINWFELEPLSPGGDTVSVQGRQLLVNGIPFLMKGVCWNPIGVGGSHPWGLDFAGYVAEDGDLMAAAGINTIRTYEALTEIAVLDALYARGIYVINTMYSYGPKSYQQVIDEVNAVKDHPAILMWSLGNEWNYNGLYADFSFNECVSRINDVAALVKAADPTRPIATVYGVWGNNLPPQYLMSGMPNIDVWGINIYNGLDFEDLMGLWAGHSSKPMFIAEYGADAFNANTNRVDLNSQGYATRVLTQIILDNSNRTNPSKVCIGGTIFEWADEWWKAGNIWQQDTGGTAPGGGPYPDFVFNEEFWGIVDIYRNPRPAYYELRNLFLGN